MRSVTRVGIVVLVALAGATGALAQDFDDVAAGAEIAPAPEQQFGIDWSVGLRGSYAANSLTGGKPSLSVTPEASLTLGGESSTSVYASGAELIVDGAGQARLAEGRLGVDHSYRLSPTTSFTGSLDGVYSQADPDSSGLPANTLHAPQTFEATAQAGVTQDMGHFDARLVFDGARRIVGETTLDDLSTVDNTHQSYWQGGATLRLGYELSPLLAVFVEGEVSEQKFDAPDPTLLAYLDGRTYELRTGLSYAQGSIISAEASVGRGWLDYHDAGLTDAQDWIYNASLTLRPDETLALTSALETTLSPSTNVPGDTDVGYTLTAAATYDVNPWLTLRGSAGWDRTVTLGTGDQQWSYDLGAGLDYRSSRHVVWTADYTYARDYVPPTPENDTHTVLLGVRVTR